MELNFEAIANLKFQEAIKLNEKILYRAQEYPEWNNLKTKIDYSFYESWNKKESILPKPQYIVTLYVKIESERKKDGWIKNRVKEYEKGELINLENNKKESITSIQI